jgi:hypothetical protein
MEYWGYHERRVIELLIRKKHELEKWWDEEGSVMHEQGCSVDVIVNAAWKAATLFEREECAKVCEVVIAQDVIGSNDSYIEGRQMGATVCMNSIRKRSNRPTPP